jgi:hypothetical protein
VVLGDSSVVAREVEANIVIVRGAEANHVRVRVMDSDNTIVMREVKAVISKTEAEIHQGQIC